MRNCPSEKRLARLGARAGKAIARKQPASKAAAQYRRFTPRKTTGHVHPPSAISLQSGYRYLPPDFGHFRGRWFAMSHHFIGFIDIGMAPETSSKKVLKRLNQNGRTWGRKPKARGEMVPRVGLSKTQTPANPLFIPR